MTTESIPIPAERVPPIATDMASSSKSIAAVLLFVCVIIGIAMLGATFEDSTQTYEDPAEMSGALVAALIMGGVPGYFGFRSARNASRANRAAALAKSEPSYTWRLAGKWVITTDGAGAPRPDLSFKINRKLRTMLLAVPRAEVRAS